MCFSKYSCNFVNEKEHFFALTINLNKFNL